MTQRLFHRNSGIYQIKNVVNNNIYIGQSTSLSTREYNHFRLLDRNQCHNPHLQSSYNKYGRQNFVFEILMYCDVDDLDYYEQTLVDELSPKYNIRKDVRSNRGHKTSEETKRKISLAQIGKTISDETRRRQSDSHKGKKLSPNTRKKMSERMMGHKINLGRVQSQEEKDKRAIAIKEFWKTHGKKVISQETKKRMSIARLSYLEKHK